MKKNNILFLITLVTGLILISLVFSENIRHWRQGAVEVSAEEHLSNPSSEPSPGLTGASAEQGHAGTQNSRIRQQLEDKGLNPHPALFWKETD